MSTDAPHLDALTIVSLRDHIKRQIVDAILGGVFKPGERLIEATIADQLGVSRAPVREALVALEQSAGAVAEDISSRRLAVDPALVAALGEARCAAAQALRLAGEPTEH